MGEAAVLAPEAAMVGGEAAGIGLVDGASAGTGFFGDLFSGFSTPSLSSVAGAASIAGLALQAGSSQMKGQAAQAQGYQSIAQGQAARAQGVAALAQGQASYARSQGEQASDEFQASRAERAGDFGRMQADLTDTQYREDLNNTLANIDVIRSAAHIDPRSPTTAAVEDRQTELSNRQRDAAAITIRSQVSEDEESAKFLHAAGANAILQGSYAKSIGEYGARVGEYGGKVGDYGASLAGYIGDMYKLDTAGKLASGIGKMFG